MADSATIPVNDDGTIDRISVGGVEHRFALSVNEESLANINAATKAANTAAAQATSKADAAVSEMKTATGDLSAQVLAAIGYLSVDNHGRLCITYEEEN